MGRSPIAGPTGRLSRPPVAAGTFYPADPAELRATVARLLTQAPGGGGGARRPRALVAPHAGYVYSGRVAAAAFASLGPPETLQRVAILGPAHFGPLRGVAVPAATAWTTPLGDVAIDETLRAAARAAGAWVDDRPHRPEHAVEVQLPFLQTLSPRVAVLPVAIGADERVAETVLDALWDLADLTIVSTDLSHYLDDATARTIDGATALAVTTGDADGIGAEGACGVHALRALVRFCHERNLEVRLVALTTSFDATGDASRVVGYGAFSIGGMPDG